MPIKKLQIDNLHPANPLNDIVANINENLDAIVEIVDGINGGTPVMGGVGPKGDQGAEGRVGPPGQDGKDGRDGKDGEQGPAGKDGKDGQDGANGADGLPGVNGKDGQDGLPGRDGVDGKDGLPGVNGKDGKDGTDGAPGKDGLPGIQGPQGPAGKDGTNGKDGAPGPQGIQGPAGKDGVNGKDGSPGIQGPQGVAGPAGKDGVGISTATINTTTGNLIFTKTDGTTIDAGNVKTPTTTTTTTTTSGPPVVGGAINPMYSPVATTTTMKGYIAAYVNAGVFLTLDNLKFSVTTTGNRGLCCATVTGTATLSIGATYSCTGGGNGHSTAWPGAVTTTTPSGSWFGYHFPNAGDTSTYLVNDNTNQRVYRVHLQIGPGYSGNFISIERLL